MLDLTLVEPDNPILTTPCKHFNFTTRPLDPVELAQSLVYRMYELNGIGLAANQVGLPYRAFAMRGSPQNFVCFNPRIVDVSAEEVALEEGCLTWPGMFVEVKRPISIKVRFQTPNSEVLTQTFRGLTARTFQHEMDHLDGKVFYMRATRYHREQAFKKWEKEYGIKAVLATGVHRAGEKA